MQLWTTEEKKGLQLSSGSTAGCQRPNSSFTRFIFDNPASTLLGISARLVFASKSSFQQVRKGLGRSTPGSRFFANFACGHLLFGNWAFGNSSFDNSPFGGPRSGGSPFGRPLFGGSALRGGGFVLGLLFLILSLIIITPELAMQSGLVPMVPVLVYHAVLPEALGPLPDDGNTLSQEHFAEQMHYLWSHGYHPISLEELRNYLLHRKPLPRLPVVITFDDGYENNYLYAYPILKKYGFRATINVIVSRIGSNQHRHSPILAPLNWSQLREMAQSGLIDVESHTYNSHDPVAIDAQGTPGYPLLGPVFRWDLGRLETQEEYRQRVLQDLRQAKAVIEREMGRPCTTFTYPYGKETPLLQQLVREAGYTMALTSHRGLNYYPGNPMSIKRIPISQRDDLNRFILKLRPSGEIFYTWLRKRRP